jgi:hypothetical protein
MYIIVQLFCKALLITCNMACKTCLQIYVLLRKGVDWIISYKLQNRVWLEIIKEIYLNIGCVYCIIYTVDSVLETMPQCRSTIDCVDDTIHATKYNKPCHSAQNTIDCVDDTIHATKYNKPCHSAQNTIDCVDDTIHATDIGTVAWFIIYMIRIYCS